MAVALASGWLAGAPAAAGPESTLAGLVKDALGRTLEGVEILVADPAGGVRPLALRWTDATGRFVVADLPPGSYRIAALKDGYVAAVAGVDTRVARWLDVVLHPTPDPGAQAIASDSAWALRLPRRYLLHETDADPAAAVPPVDEAAPTPLVDLVDLEVAHLFALRGGLGGAGGSAPGLAGTETEVRVGSALGDRGQLRVEGFRESLEADALAAAGPGSASRDAARLQVDFAYDAAAEDRVAVAAYFGKKDLAYAAAEAVAEGLPAKLEQAERSWGYDASWTRELSTESRLGVQVDVRDTTVELPQRVAELADDALDERLAGRTVRAAGSFESAPFSDHKLEVGFRAQLLESPDPTLRVANADAIVAYGGVDGLSVGVDAQDTWSVAGPFSLVYGIGYRHAMRAADPALVVPRVGGAWRLGQGLLRLVVSYHAAASGEAEADAEGLGYDLQVEVPLPFGLRLAGGASEVPAQIDVVGHAGRSAASAMPVFVTDGSAAVAERRLALLRDAGPLGFALEASRGEAVGMLVAVAPIDLPVHRLDERALEYTGGRVELRMRPWGTDLAVEYVELEQAPRAAGGPPESAQSALEVSLSQDVLRMSSLGTWRVLVAARSTSLEGSPSEGLSRHDATMLAALGRRFSAGVSVVF